MMSFDPENNFTKPFDALVVSGGGNYCIKQLAALVFLEREKNVDFASVKYYSGTSCGSILVALMAIGYSPFEIYQRLIKFPKIKLTQINIREIFTNFSLLNLDPLINNLEIMFAEKGFTNATFEDVYRLREKILFITGSNMEQMIEEDFSFLTQPNMKITEAIKISCSYPIIFPRHEFNGTYFSDGGIFNNIPIDLVFNIAKKNILVLYINYDTIVSTPEPGQEKKSLIKYINDTIIFLCFKNDYNKIKYYKNYNHVIFFEILPTETLRKDFFFLSLPIIKEKGNSFVGLFTKCYKEIQER